MNGRERERGFTLLELLVVLVVAVLIMTMAVPYLRRGPGRRELAASVHDVAAALRTARAQAISANRPEAFLIDVDRGTYGPQGRRLDQLPRGIGISLTTTAAQVSGSSEGMIRFFPDGSSTGGAVTLAQGGLRYSVSINWLDGGVNIREAAIGR